MTMTFNPLADFSTAQLITELRRRANPIGPAESGWIVGFLPPGNPFGHDRLTSKQHGVELDGDTTIVDTPAELVRLGLDLFATFEPYCRPGKRPTARRLPRRAPRDT
jgi:hypothetical protein